MPIPKRHTIRIPREIKLIYDKKHRVLTLIGSIRKRSLKLKLKLGFLKTERRLYVSQMTANYRDLPSRDQKLVRSIQGTTIALILQNIRETSSSSFKHLKLVGVGYKAITIESYGQKFLKLQLGYSHLVIFRINLSKIDTGSFKKSTQLYIIGNSYTYVCQIAAKIRAYKKPEPYKGKGFLYINEQIVLKEGKKI